MAGVRRKSSDGVWERNPENRSAAPKYQPTTIEQNAKMHNGPVIAATAIRGHDALPRVESVLRRGT